jgi:hypothetical protein
MDIRLRTTRTLKVTEVDISRAEKELLSQLFQDPRYEALVNVMERACISLETAHLNTSVGNPEEILGGHAVAKSAWLFFTWIQKAVFNSFHTRTEDGEEVAAPSLEDAIQGVETYTPDEEP